MADESPKKKPSKTHITDPLEAAKMDKPAPVAAAPAPAPVEAAPVVEAAAPAAKPGVLKSYRVVKTTTVSLHGQMVRLNEGDVISAASHGPQAIERILDSNVALAEVK